MQTLPCTTSARTPVKCLLVDDLADNLAALSAILRRDDVELLTAQSGAQALDLLLTHDIALALLDVQMPEMDGFQLAELMRSSERTRNVPIIFVTAGAHDPLRLFRGYDQGAVDFLYKPLDATILVSKAEVFFEIYRQRKQLAEELLARTQTLQLNEMFMGILGHDLRNPLNAIILNAHVLQTVGDQLVRDMADSIIASGQRMARLIQDLLDVTRARQGGGFSVMRERADMQAIVNGVVEEHRTANQHKSIEMDARGVFDGEWDRDRIAQALSNLIGNACVHGAKDGAIAVEVDGLHADHIVLVVRNEGEIPAALLPSIFEPFTGRSTNAPRAQGLGLGLYIVQQIVLAHAGHIEVHSRYGTTRFIIKLPRRK